MVRFPLAAWCLLGIACGSPPEPARPTGTEFIEVDYPPPPARIEEMTDTLAGRPECQWMDGHYMWQGRRWEWLPGQWVVPARGCLRAPPTLTWLQRNPPRLDYTPPYWYVPGATASANARACPAATSCLHPTPSAP